MNHQAHLFKDLLNKYFSSSEFSSSLSRDGDAYLLNSCSRPGGAAEVILIDVNLVERQNTILSDRNLNRSIIFF